MVKMHAKQMTSAEHDSLILSNGHFMHWSYLYGKNYMFVVVNHFYGRFHNLNKTFYELGETFQFNKNGRCVNPSFTLTVVN